VKVRKRTRTTLCIKDAQAYAETSSADADALGRGRLRDRFVLLRRGERAVPDTFHNRILSGLQPLDLALLKPHLERVDLPLRRQLEYRNGYIEHAYFLEDGIVSVVVTGASASIEVGLIGSEGVTAISVLLGSQRAVHSMFVQVAGSGLRLPAETLRQVLDQSIELRRVLLRFAHAFYIQTTFTALANARYRIDERLARWLLMAQDRVGGDEIPVTQEFIAMMLGVRRSGVTDALGKLAAEGVIKAVRGRTRIVDRNRLKELSNGAYGPAELEFEKLFGKTR
jgi:CRP-like cAMP-binding protein